MREIKFRVWDKVHEEMINWEQYKDELVSSDFTDEGLILMQYTGLKDRDGVEIYVGDIVKQFFSVSTGYLDETVEGEHTGEVVIIASKGVCMRNPSMYDTDSDETIKTNQYKHVVSYRSKVIGNVFENPELLKED